MSREILKTIILSKPLSYLDITDKCYACGQSIDNTQAIHLKDDLEENLFVDNNNMNIVSKHGGHFNEQGYALVANIVKEYLSNIDK